METLQQFKQRTHYVHELSFHGPMFLNPNLSMKVNDEGQFNPFYGDTVVYLLHSNIKTKLVEYQKLLMNSCSDLLAEPLVPDTFHLTLHDLNNGPDLDPLISKMERSQTLVKELFEKLKDDSDVIHLSSTKVFSMVNTSIVLCFEPETEEDCIKLMNYYELFQEIVPLSYPLTPHITLAYYNAPYASEDEQGNWIKGRIPLNRLHHLKEVMDQLNSREPLHLSLSIYDLAYQHFTSMNHYRTKLQGEQQ